MKQASLLFFLTSVLVLCPLADAMGQIFVTSDEGEFIETADLEGSNQRILIRLDAVFGNGEYRPFAITATKDRLYWTDISQDAIYTASLDGSGARKLIDLKRFLPTTNWITPEDGLVVTDSAIYWTDSGSVQGVFRADLSGRNPSMIVNAFREGLAYQPNGLAISGENLFWSGWVSESKPPGFFTADVRGGGLRKLLDGTSGPWASGLAISGERMFWTFSDYIFGDGAGPDGIESANLDGSGLRRTVDLQRSFGQRNFAPFGITTSGAEIYWVDRNLNAVYTAGQDGASPRKLFNTLGPAPRHIAIVPPAEIPLRILKIARTPTTATVIWAANPGRTYTVHKSSDLRSWVPCPDEVVATRIREAFTDSDISQSRMFYRVIEEE